MFIIFGGQAATGALRRGVNGEGHGPSRSDLEDPLEEMGNNRNEDGSSKDDNDCSGTDARPGSQRPGVRPRCGA